MQPSPIPLFTDGCVAGSSVLWTFRGRLHLTVVVKAAFVLRQGEAASLAPAPAIVVEERTFDRNPTRSLELASDLAPYKARCDVTLLGHAFSPRTRLGIVGADGRKHLDKIVDAPGASAQSKIPLVYERALGGPGEPNPVGVERPSVVDPVDPRRAASYAPISRYWASRKQLVRGLEKGALDGSVGAIPEAFSWDYFQSAPRDQQVPFLQGAEWIVLDGVHPLEARVQSRLPAARAAARVITPSGVTPVELALDTLAIDADTLTVTVGWRGRFDVVQGEAAIPSLAIRAALDVAGRDAIDWSRVVHAAATAAPAAAKVSVGEGTMAVSEAAVAELLQRPAVPFAGGAPASVRTPASREATPWSASGPPLTSGAAGPASVRTPPVAVVGEGTMMAPGADLEATFALRPREQQRAADRPIAPFAIASPGPPSSSAPRSEALPFGGALAKPVMPASAVGEETFAIGSMRSPVAPVSASPPAPMSSPAPAAPSYPLAPAALQPPAPPPSSRAPVPPSSGTPAAAPPASPPRAVPAPPVPVSRPPAAKPPAPQADRRPATPADSLRAAGASASDVNALMAALAQPAPPPPEED